MTTLKEFLWKECLQHLDLGENGAYDEMRELESDLNTAIKKWLQEKRETAQSNYGHNEVSNAYYNGYFFAFDELIDEVSTVEQNKTTGNEKQ